VVEREERAEEEREVFEEGLVGDDFPVVLDIHE
jgi:hypothetical protein